MNKEFTDLMNGPEPPYEIIQMTESGSYQIVSKSDPDHITIESAKDFHNINPQFYEASRAIPFKLLWRKERDQILLKNSPETYKDMIKEEEVKLERAQPKTKSKPSKVMMGGQASNTYNDNSSFIESKRQPRNKIPQFKLPFDWPEGKPYYDYIYYEQEGSRDPKVVDYILLKVDITRPLPNRHIKSLGKMFKPCLDKNRAARYEKDHIEKLKEESQRKQPNLTFQQIMLFEKIAREQGKTMNEEIISPQEGISPKLYGNNTMEGNYIPPKKKVFNGKPRKEKKDGLTYKKGPGRPPKRAPAEGTEQAVTQSTVMMSQTHVPMSFDVPNTQFDQDNHFQKAKMTKMKR
jgi:hypothetical protein